MDKYNLAIGDMTSGYFHFTSLKNIENIQEVGLVPKIGIHAINLEKSKKVFFVEGLDNMLFLFDCWINVCTKYPLFPGVYNLGCILLRCKAFPKIIADMYFKYTEINKLHKFVAYKYFDHFLETKCLLKLDIKNNEDFSYEDLDQIKTKPYSRKHLIEAGYSPKYSDVYDLKMDKWNMHTFANKGIDAKKIKMCYINNSNSIIDILIFALKKTDIDIKDVCPYLFNYLKSRKIGDI